MKIKRLTTYIFQNNRNNVIPLLFVLCLISGCTIEEQALITPFPSGAIGEVEDVDKTSMPISTLPIITQSPKPTETILHATSNIPQKTITPIEVSTASQTVMQPLSEQATITSSGTEFLEPVLELDPTWSNIIQRVDELQGFYTLALSPNGQLMAAVDSYDEFSRVHLWSVDNGAEKWILELDQPLATSELTFSPDGTKLAVGTSSVVQDIFVWDVINGNQLNHFVYPESTIDVEFSPDNEYLAVSGSIPGLVTLWNLENENIIELGRGGAIDFIPHTSVLAVTRGQRFPDEPSPIFLWDITNGQKEYLFLNEYFAGSMAISPDGKYLAAYIANDESQGNLRILNIETQEEIQLNKNELGSISGVKQIDFSAEGHIGALQREFVLWNNDGDFLDSLDGLRMHSFIFTPDGSHLLTYSGFDAPLKVWQLP